MTNTTVGRGDWETGCEYSGVSLEIYPATHANHADCLDSMYGVTRECRVSAGLHTT